MLSVKLFLPTLLLFFLLDMTWLGFIGKSFYTQEIGELFKKIDGNFAPNWYAAIAVYIFFTIGILVFVLPKMSDSYWLTLAWGALLGALVYGVYDFTNYSILEKWSLTITLIDWLWGTVLCALVSLGVHLMKRYLFFTIYAN